MSFLIIDLKWYNDKLTGMTCDINLLKSQICLRLARQNIIEMLLLIIKMKKSWNGINPYTNGLIMKPTIEIIHPIGATILQIIH